MTDPYESKAVRLVAILVVVVPVLLLLGALVFVRDVLLEVGGLSPWTGLGLTLLLMACAFAITRWILLDRDRQR